MSDPKWLEIARGELGVEEPDSTKYFEATNYGPAAGNTPYCAAFVDWCLQQAGLKGTGSAAAISFKDWGDDVSDTQPIGAIVVFEWSSGGHHVTMNAGDGNFLGGNQTRAHEVCIESLPLDAAIAWRWPTGVSVN